MRRLGCDTKGTEDGHNLEILMVGSHCQMCPPGEEHLACEVDNVVSTGSNDAPTLCQPPNPTFHMPQISYSLRPGVVVTSLSRGVVSALWAHNTAEGKCWRLNVEYWGRGGRRRVMGWHGQTGYAGRSLNGLGENFDPLFSFGAHYWVGRYSCPSSRIPVERFNLANKAPRLCCELSNLQYSNWCWPGARASSTRMYSSPYKLWSFAWTTQ